MNIQSQGHRREESLPLTLSIEAFFDWAERQEARYELVRGRPRLQPWVKLNHNRIVTNLVALMVPVLDLEAFELATGDFAVRVGPNSIRYADLMILPAGKSGDLRFVHDAKVLVEVLSDSTMHVDFGEKLHEYQALDDLDTYLIFAQDGPRVWQWTRNDHGLWPDQPQLSAGLDAVLKIDRLGLSIELAGVYRNVN